MSADHAHDVEHSALPHDLELKRTRATSENHTERRDGPPQLPSLPKDDSDQSYRDFEAHKRASFVGECTSHATPTIFSPPSSIAAAQH
ncbi:hypothetical protein K525DRAFT_261541, partial [Schizophyllum commune Loenen D]